MTGLRGAAAAVLGLGVADFFATLFDGDPLTDEVGRAIIDATPLPVVEKTVELVGLVDKPLLRANVAATVAGVGFGLGRLHRHDPDGAAGLSVAVTAIGVAAALRRPPNRYMAVAMGATTGLMATNLFLRRGRRPKLAATVGLGLIAMAQTRAQARRTKSDDLHAPVTRLDPPVDGAEVWSGAKPFYTPVREFYSTDVNPQSPVIDRRQWRLNVTGRVDEVLRLSLHDLESLGMFDFDATMVCIHQRPGWRRLGTTRWTGVPVARVLVAAGAHDSQFLSTKAVDGYKITIDRFDVAEAGLEPWIITRMGGTPLMASHGAPARVFIPGIYGQYSGVKWLTEMQVGDEPGADYWTKRGWPVELAMVKPSSRIDSPADDAVVRSPAEITGVAWAPAVGIDGVDVRVNQGEWQPAELAAEVSPRAWRRWRIAVDLPPGTHTVASRARDRSGTVQIEEFSPPYPGGASGLHSITVRTSP